MLHYQLYRTLIDNVIIPCGVLDLPGDILEIGAFTGGGTKMLAELASSGGRAKSVWALDVFDPECDTTVNSGGIAMNDLYRANLPREKSQLELFKDETAGLKNVRTFIGDSRTISLPNEPLSFAFVDGGHSESCVTHDLSEVWRRLVPGGVVALHDYGGDLPEVTGAIDKFLAERSSEIQKVERHQDEWLIWIVKY